MPPTESPAALLLANRLDEAVQAAIELVKTKPADVGLRVQLAELLCLTGDLERADKQLETASTQAPQAAVRCAVYRQLIRAETARRECFTAGRPPELLENVDEFMNLQMRLLMAVRDQDWPQAAGLAGEVEATREKRSVTGPDLAAPDARDQDDLWAGVLELLTTTGKYYWVPISRLKSLSVQPPATPSELAWAVADIAIDGGPSGRVYLPTVYPALGAEQSVSVRLGRETDWRELHPGFTLGSGLRCWWLGDDERTLFELKELSFG